LRQLELDHLDLGHGGDVGELLAGKAAVVVAAAEIAGAHLPDRVSAMLQMIRAHPAFAGVVGDTAQSGAPVEREMALAESEPKDSAEMLNTEAE
jgi:hypothetical protein